jgi:predicted NUDIX family NTP pyrophosphohydrolase
LAVPGSPGDKVVHVWAIEGDWDPADLQSNKFEMEIPPRSERVRSFPEIDRAAWFGGAEAQVMILKGQAALGVRSCQYEKGKLPVEPCSVQCGSSKRRP